MYHPLDRNNSGRKVSINVDYDMLSPKPEGTPPEMQLSFASRTKLAQFSRSASGPVRGTPQWAEQSPQHDFATSTAAVNVLRGASRVHLSMDNVDLEHVRAEGSSALEKIRMWFKDPFSSLVNLSWKWSALFLICAFFASWLIWTWLILLSVFSVYGHKGPKICVAQVHDDPHSYTIEYFYWVVETMSTLGYGNYAPTCWVTNLYVCLITLYGILLEVIAFALTFSKFAYPASRATFVKISEKMCGYIPQEDRQGIGGVVAFRLMNTRKKPFYFPNLDVYLVDTVSGEDGLPKFIQLDHTISHPLDFLELPCVVSMALKEEWIGFNLNMTPSSLAGLHIVLRFSMIDPVTGNVCQRRKTWNLATEVLWNHEFKPIMRAEQQNEDLEDHYSLLVCDMNHFDDATLIPRSRMLDPSWVANVLDPIREASSPKSHEI